MHAYKFNTDAIEQLNAGLPGKTNWPADLPAAKDRRVVEFYAVDVDGETKCTAKEAASAVAAGRAYQKAGHHVMIRHVKLGEKELREEDEKRHARNWEEQLYKPTPVRTIRR
jgi:hypothetical protein